MYTPVNLVAVIIATIASMGVGFLYYSPAVLGKPWMAAMGLTASKLKQAQKEMGKTYAISAVAAFVTAWVLALLIGITGYWSLGRATWLAGKLWLGFIAPVQLTEVLFGNKKWGLFFINTGYQLASVLVMAGVLAVWR